MAKRRLRLLIDSGIALDNKPCISEPSTYPISRVMYLAIDILHTLPNKERAKSLTELLSRWANKNVMYPFIMILDEIIQGNNWNKNNNTPSSIKITFNEEEKKTLLNLMNREIHRWIRDDTNDNILKHYNAATMLFALIRINESNTRDKIKTWMNDSWKIFQLMQCMIGTTFTTGMSSPQGTVTKKRIRKDEIESLTNMKINEIKELVHKATINNPNASEHYEDVITLIDEIDK